MRAHLPRSCFYCALLLVLISFEVQSSGATCTHPGDVPLRVVTSKCKEDVRWLKTEFPGDQLVVCAKQECGLDDDADAGCSMTANAGLETAPFIKYITSRLDSGERLACELAFVHGHETAWHHRYQGPLTQAIRRSNATRSGDGYVSLNARFLGPLPPAHLREIADMWERIVAPYMGAWPCANGLFPPCCAQFRVTRERILAVPRAAWTRWLDYSLEGPAQAKQFEFLWHIIFGQPCMMPVTSEEEYIAIHFQS